jgi:hypothetical protein
VSLGFFIGRGPEAQADAIVCPQINPESSCPHVHTNFLCTFPPKSTVCAHLDLVLLISLLEERKRKVTNLMFPDRETGVTYLRGSPKITQLKLGLTPIIPKVPSFGEN